MQILIIQTQRSDERGIIMKKGFTLLISALLALTLASCTTVKNSENEPTAAAGGQPVSDAAFDLTFTKKDLDGSFDAAGAARITFTDSGAQADGKGVSVQGTLATVSAAGTYIISGECADGRIHVAAGESDDVRLVLNGLTLTSSTSAITAESADKVIITLADGTENVLTDAKDYTLTVGGSDADGAIFAKTDLTINGGGALTVNGSKKHGVVTKDSLAVTGGTIAVTAENVGLYGKDCVKIDAAQITVSAGTDAVRADNDEKADRGFVYIAGGTLDLTAGSDGIQAQTLLRVDGGEIGAVTGGGSAEGAKGQQSRDAFADFFNQNNTSDGYTESTGGKGLKCAGDVTLTGGALTLDCADDAVHADGSVTVSAGLYEIASGDDGIHADAAIAISGGMIDVTKSYEGLEAADITIDDGTVTITASDDGVNIAGGNDSGAGFDRFSGEAVTDGALTVNGGYLYVNASGDGLDSNGNISVTGGTVLVSGPENSGNGSLDYAGTATMTGGVLVAAGSSGMAQSVTGSGQGSIMTNINPQQGGVSVALTDADGAVLAAFTPAKSYSSIVFCAPGIASGNSYSIVCGGTVSGADENGFASSGTLTGGTVAAEITMDSDNYGAAGGMGGGMGGGRMPGMGPGRGGKGAQDGQNGNRNEGEAPAMPDGSRPELPDGEMPAMPDGAMPSMPDGSRPEMPDGEMPDGAAPSTPASSDGGNQV